MKLHITTMSVVTTNGTDRVSVSVALVDQLEQERYQYLGSLNCNFKQYAQIDYWIGLIPSKFIVYNNKKWTEYMENLIKEIKK